MDPVEDRFAGIARLYGDAAVHRLACSHVAVIGVGGVGSWVVEALARSGVGAITMIDLDDVCVTNTNRQLPAMSSTIGQLKVDVLAARVRDIAPGCAVKTVAEFYTAETADDLFDPAWSLVVDAVDRVSTKAMLIDHCRRFGVPVVTCGGAGGRRDPGQVRCADLTESNGDRLLKLVRKKLRRDYGFTKGEIWDIPTVYSAEEQVYPAGDGTVSDVPLEDGPVKLDCQVGFGAATFVTGTCGFMAAAAAVERLLREA
ncbi:MAG: tRNA A37 threonylcarbamoyladenosine dehydratase [Flavobacteriales bacterium]|jgi:tRNA A37 threonylcarbamoyladenosine dehydratase